MFASAMMPVRSAAQLLLIEDNPGDARLVREALSEAHAENFGLHWVDRLQVGLEHAAQKPTDLVLLDLSLPDAQGLTTIKRFTATVPNIPVVVLTGTSDAHTALRALEMGAQDYIVKDELNGKVLTRSIRYALERTRERQRFQERLLQSHKMEALGRLAGGVAHDFNNILTIIMGYAELHLSQLPPNSLGHQHISQIVTSANRAASLIRQLLAFSRKQANRPEVLDTARTLIEVGKMLRRLIDNKIEITLKTAPDLGYIKADPGQIEQVIMNLAINARDAMPKGGTLVIQAVNESISELDRRWQDPIEPGEYVTLTVRDTGSGMDRETREKIFEPFFTTKPTGQGTGLGLAMVYGIIKQAGGYIVVDSEKHRGTTVKVYLPRVFQSDRLTGNAPDPEPARRGTETILVVEDEKGLRSLIEGILTGWGYTVLLASHGEEALEVCRQHQGTIELVITDLAMPRMSGLELIEQLPYVRPGTKYLCMSGNPEEGLFQGDGIDPNAYLQKPFSADQLSASLRKVLD